MIYTGGIWGYVGSGCTMVAIPDGGTPILYQLNIIIKKMTHFYFKKLRQNIVFQILLNINCKQVI